MSRRLSKAARRLLAELRAGAVVEIDASPDAPGGFVRYPGGQLAYVRAGALRALVCAGLVRGRLRDPLTAEYRALPPGGRL